MTWFSRRNGRDPQLAEYLTTAQAAELCGVSTARIRQAVASGALIPAAVFGERTPVFHVAAVEQFRDRARVAQTGSVLGSDPGLLKRVREVPVLRSADGDLGAHVRVWSGVVLPGPFHQRVVVVLGALNEVMFPPHWALPEFAARVGERIVGPERALEAVWLAYRPEGIGVGRDEHEFTNLVFHYDTQDRFDSEGRPKFLERFDQRAVSIADVEQLVGEQIECYPKAAYTSATVERYAQTGRVIPVEFTFDRGKLMELAGHVEALAEVKQNSPVWSVARRAAATLAVEVADRSARPEFTDTAWDDGTTLRTTTDPAPSRWGARLVRPQLTNRQRQLIDELDTSDARVWPWAIDRALAERMHIEELYTLADATDTWSATPDPALHEAARAAAFVTRIYLRVHHEKIDQTITYPRTIVRSVTVTQRSWCEQYLQSVKWGHQELTTEQLNRLAASTQYAAGEVRYGIDAAGVPVALSGDTLTAIWPTVVVDHPYPPGTRFVGTGGNTSGARPVFVAIPGQSLHLLPAPPDDAGWQFGYDGGGPAALEAAITRAITTSDASAPSAELRTAIEQAVCKIPRDADLDVDLDTIRQRTAAATLRGIHAPRTGE